VNLTTSFWNPRGGQVAGTWFDTERAEWRVSTVAVRGFRTEREAIAFYHSNCDSLTGMLSMRHRAPLKSKALVRPAAKPSLKSKWGSGRLSTGSSDETPAAGIGAHLG